METKNVIIIIVVVIIIFLLQLLIKSIKYISGVQGREVSRSKNELQSSLMKEVVNLQGPLDKSVQTVKALSETINKEVEKRVSVVTMEMSKKFETVLTEKDREYKAVTEKLTKTVVEKKQTESIIRSIADGLVVLNDKGEVLMMNPAAEKLLSVSKEQQMGKGLASSLNDQQVLSLSKPKGPSGQEREIELNAQNEETKKVIRSSTAVIENENGQTIGMVSVLTDVTKQRELDHMKSHFVASVSHELRTPIVAIRNSISIMLSKTAGPVTADQEKFLTIADRNLARLNNLINDLLDLAKLESKKMELKTESASIEKVINETCETLASWAKAKQIAIARTIPPTLPLIKFDPARITQVLTNLLSNAVKFSAPKGLIVVDAKFLTERKEFIVSVSDNGVGIAKDDIPKLFSKFSQVGEHASLSELSGTGLGLAISKEIVELHGGRIWIESTLGKGTKVLFTIPVI